MTIAELVRRLAAAGATPEVIAIAVEAATDASGKTARQARNARYYATKASEKRLKASYSDAESDRLNQDAKRLKPSEIKTPLARVEDNLLPKRIVDKIDDDETRARDLNDWPPGDAFAHAAALIELAATSRLDPNRSPTLVTSMGRIAQWKRDGASWQFDVVPTVTAVCAKAKGPIGAWTYFDRAIAQSIADNRRALEIPEASNVTVFPRGQGPPGLVAQITAEKAEAKRRVLESLKAPDGIAH